MATESDAEAFGPLLGAVERLAATFAEAGFDLHLVGGSVRDSLLGQPHDGDLDLTTDARPDETLALVKRIADSVWTQGERFGTIGASIDGRPYEITTHRTERYEPSSRKPDVLFADALGEDLARRDFTINSMAVAVPSGELVDPYGGRADLAAKILRTPLAPEISFVDDPLRMLRAGRFIARFDLVPVAELVAAAREHAARLDIVSAERILDELTKLLRTERPSAGLRFLADVDVLARVLPEVDPTVDVDALPPDAATRLAALLGRAEPPAVARRLRALRASNELAHVVRSLVEAVAVMPDDPDAEAARRWVAVDPEWRTALAIGDIVAPRRAAPLRSVVEALGATEDLDDQSLPIDGGDIMRELSIPSGPQIGEALRRLRAHRFAHGTLSRREALDFLKDDR